MVRTKKFFGDDRDLNTCVLIADDKLQKSIWDGLDVCSLQVASKDIGEENFLFYFIYFTKVDGP